MPDMQVNAPGLLQLPNGDLWRGHKDTPLPAPDNIALNDNDATPLARAMAAVLKAKQGGDFNCLWCGLTFSGEKPIRDHLIAAHPSVVKPATNADAAMAMVAESLK